MLWRIIQALISVGMIVGGLSGDLVLRGTNSSGALVVFGCLWLIYDIYSIVTYGKRKNDAIDLPAQLNDSEIQDAVALINANAIPEQTTPEIICASCNNKLVAGMKFCPKCGAAAKTAEAVPAPESGSICQNCGNQLAPIMKFCPKCGVGANAGAQSGTAPQIPITQQIPTVQPATAYPILIPSSSNFPYPPQAAAPLPANIPAGGLDVRRAIGVLAAALALMIIIAFIPNQYVKLFGELIITPLFPLILGFGFYVAYRDCTKCRIIGSAALALFAVLHPFTQNSIQLFYQRHIFDFGLIVSVPSFGRSVGIAFLRSAIIALVAICGGLVLRDKRKFSQLAAIASVAILALSLFFSRSIFNVPDNTVVARTVVNMLLNAVFFFLAALLARMMTEFRSKTIQITGGARAWCIIVAVLMGISIIMNLFTAARIFAIQSLLLVPAVIGMIMLGTNRRMGFTLALIGAGLSVMTALTRMIPFSGASTTYLGFALGGLTNQVITWIIIAKAWKAPPVSIGYGSPESAAGTAPAPMPVPAYAPAYAPTPVAMHVPMSTRASGPISAPLPESPNHAANAPAETAVSKKGRTATIVLASIPYTGWLGIHRFYLGHIWMGIAKIALFPIIVASAVWMSSKSPPNPLSTIIYGVSLFGMIIWYIVDIVRAARGKMTDKRGLPLRRSDTKRPVAPMTGVGNAFGAFTGQDMKSICEICGFAAGTGVFKAEPILEIGRKAIAREEFTKDDIELIMLCMKVFADLEKQGFLTQQNPQLAQKILENINYITILAPRITQYNTSKGYSWHGEAVNTRFFNDNAQQQTPEAPAQQQKPGFKESGNKGMRMDTQSQSSAYWMSRMAKPEDKREAFVYYIFTSESDALNSMLELPYIHKAQDTGKLICDEIFSYGYYATTENNVSTGEWDAFVAGSELTHDMWKQLHEVFSKHNGRKKGDKEPDMSAKIVSSQNGNASNAKYMREDRTSGGTYVTYSAPNKADAIAFLSAQNITRQFYYVVVDTPEGSFGKDIQGIYQE